MKKFCVIILTLLASGLSKNLTPSTLPVTDGYTESAQSWTLNSSESDLNGYNGSEVRVNDLPLGMASATTDNDTDGNSDDDVDFDSITDSLEDDPNKLASSLTALYLPGLSKKYPHTVTLAHSLSFGQGIERPPKGQTSFQL